MKLFGTDGIRGPINTYPMVAEMALKLGQGIASLLPRPPHRRPCVLIGRDTRGSGPMLEQAIVSGLISCGCDVAIVGILPTPAVAFATLHHHCDAGIMLTASHNPATDNGIKIFAADGYKLSDSQEAELEHFLLDPQSRPALAQTDDLGEVRYLNHAADAYLAHLRQACCELDLRGQHVVVDCGHGAASALAEPLLRSLGAVVTLLNASPNGKNINANCGALHPEQAAECVKQSPATLAVCLDGDADRAIFIDETGAVLSGDRVIALCALDAQQRGALAHETVVVTVMSNAGLHATMRQAGIKSICTAVGDRHVLETMRRGGFVFGGENSGHLIFAEHATTGDGLLATLMLLALVQRRQQSLSQLAQGMEEYPACLLSFAVSAKPALESLATFGDAVTAANNALGEHGRQLIRYSGTEHKARVLVEHRDADVAAHWAERLRAALLSAIAAHASTNPE